MKIVELENKKTENIAILIDGNNWGFGIKKLTGENFVNIDYIKLIPKLVDSRQLKYLRYFREGFTISDKFSERLERISKQLGYISNNGYKEACDKNADIVLTLRAIQIALDTTNKID